MKLIRYSLHLISRRNANVLMVFERARNRRNIDAKHASYIFYGCSHLFFKS